MYVGLAVSLLCAVCTAMHVLACCVLCCPHSVGRGWECNGCTVWSKHTQQPRLHCVGLPHTGVCEGIKVTYIRIFYIIHILNAYRSQYSSMHYWHGIRPCSSIVWQTLAYCHAPLLSCSMLVYLGIYVVLCLYLYSLLWYIGLSLPSWACSIRTLCCTCIVIMSSLHANPACCPASLCTPPLQTKRLSEAEQAYKFMMRAGMEDSHLLDEVKSVSSTFIHDIPAWQCYSSLV